MRLDVLRPPVMSRRMRRGLSGLADDFSTPANADIQYAPADSFTTPANADIQYAPAASGPLSSSPINWSSMLPNLIGAGLQVYNTSTAADIQKAAIGAGAGTQQVQAAYGIAPPGYTYRGTAYNVQSSYGSSMPAGYSPTYGQPAGSAQPYVAAPAAGMSNTTLLLLLGGAAFLLMGKKRGKE